MTSSIDQQKVSKCSGCSVWRPLSLPLECGEQADVAQLVEQLIRNQQVNGSSPFVGSISFPSCGGPREPVLVPDIH